MSSAADGESECAQQQQQPQSPVAHEATLPSSLRHYLLHSCTYNDVTATHHEQDVDELLTEQSSSRKRVHQQEGEQVELQTRSKKPRRRVGNEEEQRAAEAEDEDEDASDGIITIDCTLLPHPASSCPIGGRRQVATKAAKKSPPGTGAVRAAAAGDDEEKEDEDDSDNASDDGVCPKHLGGCKGPCDWAEWNVAFDPQCQTPVVTSVVDGGTVTVRVRMRPRSPVY